jgi:hypothetical protein
MYTMAAASAVTVSPWFSVNSINPIGFFRISYCNTTHLLLEINKMINDFVPKRPDFAISFEF